MNKTKWRNKVIHRATSISHKCICAFEQVVTLKTVDAISD